MGVRGQRGRPAGGFTLIEIAVVIVVLALLLAMIAGIATALISQQRREITRQRLAGVETAIALFVSLNQRLPCPANGALPSTDASAGAENPTPANGACANNQQSGVVPWRALGLAEQDITDGWGNRMTYRASPDFVAVAGMNMTLCDPAGTANRLGAVSNTSGWCSNPGPVTSFDPVQWTDPKRVVSGRGLEVRNLAGTVIMNPVAFPAVSTGAAYVVISHGENAKGGYTSAGAIRTDWRATWEDTESQNSAASALAAFYVDDFPTDDAVAQRYFDDLVLRPTILSVAGKAQLGPRAH